MSQTILNLEKTTIKEYTQKNVTNFFNEMNKIIVKDYNNFKLFDLNGMTYTIFHTSINYINFWIGFDLIDIIELVYFNDSLYLKICGSDVSILTKLYKK